MRAGASVGALSLLLFISFSSSLRNEWLPAGSESQRASKALYGQVKAIDGDPVRVSILLEGS